jgi:hypothetical protein
MLLWYNHSYGVTSTNIFYIFNVYSNEMHIADPFGQPAENYSDTLKVKNL